MTRHRAAQVLVTLFGIGFLLIVLAGLIGGMRGGALTETYTEVILSAAALLVGAVGGFLSRKVEGEEEDDGVKSQVGYALAGILGAMTLMFGVTLLVGAVWLDFGDQDLSGNAVNILTVLVGGTVGALGAYLGLNPPPAGLHPLVESDPDPEQPEPEDTP